MMISSLMMLPGLFAMHFSGQSPILRQNLCINVFIALIYPHSMLILYMQMALAPLLGD
jgi:hypothetical protein